MPSITQHGEYWIINGQALFADGDVGDMNHEAYVLEALLSELREDVSSMGLPLSIEDESDQTTVRCSLIDQFDQLEREGTLTPEQAEDAYAWLAEEIGWPMAKLDITLGNTDDDLRWYAAREWGWIRLEGPHLTACGPLTNDMVSSVADGLWDAYGDSLELEEARCATVLLEVMQETENGFKSDLYRIPVVMLMAEGMRARDVRHYKV